MLEPVEVVDAVELAEVVELVGAPDVVAVLVDAEVVDEVGVVAERVIVVVTWWTVVAPQPAAAAAHSETIAMAAGRVGIASWCHAAAAGDAARERRSHWAGMLYRLLFDRVLARLDPESVHVATARVLGALGALPGFRALLAALVGRPDPCLEVHALGRRFPSPLGVAAGLDKNLDWYRELGALGFGYVEVGTITAHAQPGNPRPRVRRLPADRALINSMGFPGAGAAAAQRRLRARPATPIVAVNIGRTRAAADTRADYRESVQTLAPHADLLVLNVSSPNTPGLRDLQAVDALRELVGDVRAELAALGLSVPLLVKIAPDLADAEIDALAAAAVQLSLDGLVCTNTTVSRDGLLSPAQLSAAAGGVSGAPLKARALAVLRRVRAVTGDRLVLVSVGGIETADDALARIRAGATLVQAYTGFVYGGPAWPAAINRGLATRVRELGVSSITGLIGTEASVETTAV